MRKVLVLLVVMACSLGLIGFAQAGTALTRGVVSFVHVDEEIVVPESGAYLIYNEQNGIEYYRWTVKEKEEYCEDLGLKGRACDWGWLKCFGAKDGEGTELPIGVNPPGVLLCEDPPKFDRSQCYNIDSDTMFFTKDVSIAYGTPGECIPIEVLVYNACLNQTVQVRGAGHTFKPLESIDVRFLVWKLNDNGPTGKHWLRLETEWMTIPVNVDGTFTTELEGGYTFSDLEEIKHDGTGAYLFVFQVRKAPGVFGKAKSKVIVHDCETPESVLTNLLSTRGITR
jgi:hypothetical protein